ncbi:MAG: GNAT family N-acetyltransferase [OCS116 cluster bacterium]|uniref:BioF2-like acetyltransferase domain-containing protein n=1 Tax=OCS116 cluster bacterium TaxID=2030921 RepID=A0A2A4YXI1_9PROT|nr:GNAT family N-acetyltransferase [OCS116 cluster bacterium]
MLNSNFDQLSASSDAKSIAHNDDKNNIFSSPHWFEGGLEENIFSFFEGGEEQGSNAIHVKFNNVMGFKSAEMAGEPYIQYNDMIKNGAQSVDGFMEYFLKYLKTNKVDALHLHNVRGDAHIFEYCQANGIILEQKQAPFLNMTNYADFDAYFDSLSKQTRYKYKKLLRTHECEYNIYVDDEISRGLVEHILAQKSAQLDLRGQTSRLFSDQAKMAQLADKLSTPSADYKTYISTFKIDGVIASSSVFFIKNGTLYFYILAMDDDYAKLSPGNNIVLKNIEAAYSLNCHTFDFLAPNDIYKLKWSRGDAMPVYDILLPVTTKGKLIGLGYLKFIRPILKKVYLSVKNHSLFKRFYKLMK